MGDSSVFDNLVSDLNPEERREMLARIGEHARVSEEALYESEYDAGPSHGDYESLYRDLPLLRKFIVFLKTLFSGRSREEVLRDDAVAAVAHSLTQAAPGIVDHRRRRILGAFHRELSALRDASRYFRALIDRTADKGKEEFVAFLASVELPEVNEAILNGIDPFEVERREPNLPDDGVLDAVRSFLDGAIAGIDDRLRFTMAHDFRWIQAMRTLSSFLFDHFLAAFSETGDRRWECPYPQAADLLSELVDRLAALSEPPSLKLLEALALYAGSDEGEPSAQNAEAGAKSRLAEIEPRLGVIRDFNRKIPLVKLTRVVKDDPDWSPKPASAADDWVILYREFWKGRVEGSFRKFKAIRARCALDNEIDAFVGAAGRAQYQALGSRAESVPPITRAATLQFLAAFYSGVFVAHCNRPLKVVLVDGEFYKRDNRVEFADAYSELLKIEDEVRRLDGRLSPVGDLSEAYVAAKNEMIAVPIKKRKIETAVMSAEIEAERIEKEIVDALRTMVAILRGVLSGDAGGHYDSLSNLGSLDGKNNKEFLKTLEKAKSLMEKALTLHAALAQTADADADE